ncbi:MAG TPA: alpha/beta hydrolase [Blastocatellia bacterium]|nr:alpha/beta hydrolase [Blastocatellia bacterium]
MPVISINESPLNPGISPVEIHYREYGSGRPLVFLHGGWGYGIYPFDSQIEALASQHRIIIPDRTGYGRSMRLETLPSDFHQRAAVETISLLDALGIDRPVLWGHSDGAVIAAMMGLRWPDLFAGVILEAFHYYRFKPASREFFETMSGDPHGLGERVCGVLSSEHGEDYWHKIILSNGRAWLQLADESSEPGHDIYDGTLSQLAVPTLFIHGSRDPRTEPDELDAMRREVPGARFEVLEGAGHSPHSASSSAEACTRVAADFLATLRSDQHWSSEPQESS